MGHQHLGVIVPGETPTNGQVVKYSWNKLASKRRCVVLIYSHIHKLRVQCSKYSTNSAPEERVWHNDESTFESSVFPRPAVTQKNLAEIRRKMWSAVVQDISF